MWRNSGTQFAPVYTWNTDELLYDTEKAYMSQRQLAHDDIEGSKAGLQSPVDYVAAHWGALLWALGVIVLAVLAVLAHGVAQFPGDAGIVALLQPLRGTFLAAVINFPSDINSPVTGGILAAAIIAVIAVLRRFIEAITMALWTFGTDLLNAIINGVVARPRPHNVHVQTISGLGSHSFPSGHVEHVTMLFGFLFFLTLLACTARPELRTWLLPVQAICVYFIALIGVGRVIEGAHQPSDVLAGYLMAALMLPLAIMFYRWLEAKWQRHQQRKHEEASLSRAH
jgi:membrane-associated phospholipid phosphatase